MASMIQAGSDQDPAVWFPAWLREQIETGSVPQQEWTRAVGAIHDAACGMDLETYNSSIQTVRGFMTGAQLEVPPEFPDLVTAAELVTLRSQRGCMAAEPKKSSKGILVSLGVAALTGGVLYLIVRSKSPKKGRKALKGKKRKMLGIW